VTTDPARCAVIPTTGSEHVVLGTIGGLMILGGLALFASVTWLPAYLARRKR
jgi:LPXTG-motif cell wall-anchored protein